MSALSAPTLLHHRTSNPRPSSSNNLPPRLTMTAADDDDERAAAAADAVVQPSISNTSSASPTPSPVETRRLPFSADVVDPAPIWFDFRSPVGGGCGSSGRRWSHQRALGTIIVADTLVSPPLSAGDDVRGRGGSVVSVYATPRGHLSPVESSSRRASDSIDLPGGVEWARCFRPPPDVIAGTAADHPPPGVPAPTRANSITAAVVAVADRARRVSLNACSQYVREHLMSFSQPSDNRLAMKLFGNKNAFVRDKMRRSQVLNSAAAVGAGIGLLERSAAVAEAAGTSSQAKSLPVLGTGSFLIHPCSNFRSAAVTLQFSRTTDRQTDRKLN